VWTQDMFCIAKKSNVGSGIKLSNQDYVTSVCTDRETLSRVSNILTNRQIDKPLAFSFGYCVVCVLLRFNYGLWLSLWYLQILLVIVWYLHTPVTSVCTDRETLSRVSNILTNRQIDKPTIENCDLKTCLHTSCILISQHL
jgi:hypothetical protein